MSKIWFTLGSSKARYHTILIISTVVTFQVKMYRLLIGWWSQPIIVYYVKKLFVHVWPFLFWGKQIGLTQSLNFKLLTKVFIFLIDQKANKWKIVETKTSLCKIKIAISPYISSWSHSGCIQNVFTTIVCLWASLL